MQADEQIAVCERFIWDHNAASLREQPLVDPASWAGAMQHDLVTYGVEAALQSPTAPGPAYLNAAVVMMAKDEADIIGENLTWLYFLGIRRFVINDNGSTDATAAIIERFRRANRDAELLLLNDPLIRYMQAEKTTGLYRLAVSIWPDVKWVIPADADEFLVAEKGLSALDGVAANVDALSIPKVIHFKRRSQISSSGSAMAKMDLRSPMFCVPPKILPKTNIFTTITQGNHRIRLIDDRPAIYAGGFNLGFYYREFPTRSFEHLLRKVRNGGPAVLAAEAYLGYQVGGGHWVRYYQSLMAGGENEILEIYNRDWLREVGGGFISDPFVVDASELH